MITEIRLRNMASIFITDFTGGSGRILLLYKYVPFMNKEYWLASAGGHMESDEINDPQACLWREIREELDLGPDDLLDVKLKYVTIRISGNEIRYNYYYFGRLAEPDRSELSNAEGVLQWFPVEEISGLVMPYTAGDCLKHYFTVGMHSSDLYHYNGSNRDIVVLND